MTDPLLRKLNSRSIEEQEEGKREARALPPEELLRLLETEVRHRHKRLRQIVWPISMCAFLVQFVLFFCEPPRAFWYIYGFYAPILYWACSISPALRQLTMLVEQTEDPRYVLPALLLNNNNTDRVLRRTLHGILIRLLPHLHADHVLSWSKQEKAALLEPLKRSRVNYWFGSVLLEDQIERDYLLAILKALEQVGDAEAIPVVEKLAARKETSGPWQQIAQAARECLPYLQANATRQQATETLLRPASQNNAAEAEVLVRPAASVSATPSEQLLRSVQTTERET